MKSNHPKKLGEVSNILPKQIVSAFFSNPPVQAKTIVKGIRCQGILFLWFT